MHGTISPKPVSLAEDRSIAVPPGMLVKTSYVHVDRIRFVCRDRMAVGDVDRAYQAQLQLGQHQKWPPPVGQWRDGRFEIFDGRHAYVAALMIGHTHILVAWLERT